ncbi:hypothetical protein JXB28_02220 [Candidatus Woesearchaeota archaeon]|nr:hypothetical protein [Candidatus Woesearchaeota archaeon]
MSSSIYHSKMKDYYIKEKDTISRIRDDNANDIKIRLEGLRWEYDKLRHLNSVMAYYVKDSIYELERKLSKI